MSHDLQALVPASVTVVFPRSDAGALTARVHAVSGTLASLAISEYGTATGHPGAKILYGSAVATFVDSAATVPTNAAELNALAAQAARDWYRWQLGREDVWLAGACPWTPDGLSDVEFVHDGRLQTHVARGPWNDFGDVLPSANGAGLALAVGNVVASFYAGNLYAGDLAVTNLTVYGTTTLEGGVSCCTLAGLTVDDCLRLTLLSASGACDCSDPAVDLLLAYDAVGDEWTTDEVVTICGEEYQPVFNLLDGREWFGLRTTTGASGGETTYWAVRACCCGDDCVVFALGGDVCTGVRDCPATPPSENVLRFSVEWEACPNPLYYGPGWYLVDGVCTELTEDPGVCKDITAGPFDTEADCGDPTPDPLACLGLAFGAGSGDGTLVVSNGTGDCTCADGTVPGGAGGTDTKSWATISCAGNQTITLSCSGGFYALAVNAGATATLVSASSDPFVLVYDVTGATCGGAGPTGTYRVTITHPGP